MQKRKEYGRYGAEGKLSDDEVRQVGRRTDVVSYALMAEMSHFQKERVADFTEAMRGFLRNQVSFYRQASHGGGWWVGRGYLVGVFSVVEGRCGNKGWCEVKVFAGYVAFSFVLKMHVFVLEPRLCDNPCRFKGDVGTLVFVPFAFYPLSSCPIMDDLTACLRPSDCRQAG